MKNLFGIKTPAPLFVAAALSLAVSAGAQQAPPARGGQGSRIEGFTLPYSNWFEGGALPAIPELSKKMNKILALREIVRVGWTRQDIQAVLPTLKSLRDAEKAMRSASEKVLDEEEKALLAAEPANVPKEDSGQKIRGELEKYRKAESDAWRTIGAAVGRQKTLSLRALLGSFPYTIFQGSGAGGQDPFWFQYGGTLSPTAPAPGGKPGSPRRNYKSIPPGPETDPTSGGLTPAMPPTGPSDPSVRPPSSNPGVPPATAPRPGTDPLAPPSGGPDPALRPGQGMPGGPPSPFGIQDPVLGWGQGMPTVPANPFGTQDPNFGPGQWMPGAPPNFYGAQDPTANPGRRFQGFTVQPGMQINLNLPRLSLSELIDLLEQKLGALKK